MNKEYTKYYLDDVNNSSTQKKFNYISTFTGGGGSSIGMKLAGGNTLLVNEFVKEALSTFITNFPDTNYLAGDISDFSGMDFLKKANIERGELDILEGSPPCSAFSIAGSRDKGWNKTKKYSSGQTVTNIEDLFFEFLRIADDIKPKIILAENVVGLTVGNAKQYLTAILNKFDDIGYFPTYKIFKGSDFGIPQNRPRVIFVGIRKDIAEKTGFNSMNILNVFPETSKTDFVFKDAMKDISDVYQYGDKEFLDTMFNRRCFDEDGEPKQYKKCIEELKHQQLYGYDDPVRDFDGNLNYSPVIKNLKFDTIPGVNKYFNYFLLHEECIVPTLTQMGLNAANFVHPSGERLITIKETSRLFGLPEDYILDGAKMNHKFERIGRMVIPNMYKSICESLYKKVLVHAQ